MPAQFDLAGVFDIVLQVMGLTQDRIREKAVEHIGEENVAMLEHVWGFIDAAISGGMAGLWGPRSGRRKRASQWLGRP